MKYKLTVKVPHLFLSNKQNTIETVLIYIDTSGQNNFIKMRAFVLHQNKSTIYRPDVHNVQTRTVSFPDQEKLLEKVDSG